MSGRGGPGNMIRIAVVEDETEQAETILSMLKRYEKENDEPVAAEHFRDGLAFLESYTFRFDCVFMDIDMPHMNGMDCAVELRRTDKKVNLVFVTNLVGYAVKGYEVGALGYIVKPVRYAPLSVLLDKLAADRRKNREKEVVLRKGETMRRIPVSELYYVEVMAHDLIFHTKDGTVTSPGKMKDAETELSPHGFFRCHNSYLVNLQYVYGVGESDLLVGKERVPLSRRKKKEILEAVNDFLRGGR